jgi:dipeptidase D
MLSKILENFSSISKIPRCSYKEQKVAKFFIEWAQKKGYLSKKDNAGNVVITIEATP